MRKGPVAIRNDGRIAIAVALLFHLRQRWHRQHSPDWIPDNRAGIVPNVPV